MGNCCTKNGKIIPTKPDNNCVLKWESRRKTEKFHWWPMCDTNENDKAKIPITTVLPHFSDSELSVVRSYNSFPSLSFTVLYRIFFLADLRAFKSF